MFTVVNTLATRLVADKYRRRGVLLFAVISTKEEIKNEGSV